MELSRSITDVLLVFFLQSIPHLNATYGFITVKAGSKLKKKKVSFLYWEPSIA